MDKKLVYFGTDGRPGHFFFGGSSPYAPGLLNDFPGINKILLLNIDGAFTPGNTARQGIYQVSIVPPVIIVAWHDYTIDSRPGSNSNLIGMGYENAQEMIDDAIKKFPHIMSRQPGLEPNIR